jgi:hypothetical protein
LILSPDLYRCTIGHNFSEAMSSNVNRPLLPGHDKKGLWLTGGFSEQSELERTARQYVYFPDELATLAFWVSVLLLPSS